MPGLRRPLNFFPFLSYPVAMASGIPPLDRRRLLFGAVGFAAPALAATPANFAEIVFEVDGGRLRACLGRRLRDGLNRVFADRQDFFAGAIALDAAGVRVKLRRAEDMSALAAALPRLDPGLRPASEPAQGLSIGALAADEARIDWSEAAFAAQAGLWRDRAKKMLEKALAPRKALFFDRDARTFVLTAEGMDRARWLAWIGGRIDLFFPAVFSLAPAASAAGPATFSPRPFPGAGSVAPLAAESARMLGNEDDVFIARAQGSGAGERLALALTHPGADLFAAGKLPGADQSVYALMFDKALAARAVLDGPAEGGRMRLRIESGLGAAELAERIFLGGSAPAVRQGEARFGQRPRAPPDPFRRP
jgi:hypothetical protein